MNPNENKDSAGRSEHNIEGCVLLNLVVSYATQGADGILDERVISEKQTGLTQGVSD